MQDPTPAKAPNGHTEPLPAVPEWARRAERAVPHLTVPTLTSVGATHLLERQRRLIVLFLTRTAGGLVSFVMCASHGWWIGLAPSMWVVYGGSIATVHQLIHSSLGLSPRVRRFWISVTAAVVLESGHALQATHLLHHRADSSAPDPEGYIEYVAWRRMPLEALRFRYRLMQWGLQFGNRRQRIRLEVAFHPAAHIGALLALPWTPVPALYVGAILLASASFGVMAGKGPQTNYGRPLTTPLVKVTARLAGMALFSHDRHLEHHAYPKVPLSRLRQLDSVLAPVFADLPVQQVRLP